MDPNQTAVTTPSRVNDIDLIGSDSGTEVTPTGLTGANDATGTTQRQRIPLIATSSQDRSVPINQTSIPERVGNHPGARQSADDLTRSQSRPISPTPLAQTREEITKLRGMLSSLIDEIRNQRVANQTITNRLDQAEREFAEQRAANIRERNQAPLDPLRATDPQRSIRTLHGRKLTTTPTAGHDPRSLSYSGLDEIDPGSNAHEALRSNSRLDQRKDRENREHGSHRRTIRSPKIELHLPRGPSTKRDSITQQNKLGGMIFAVLSISIPKGKT
ncbi:hypothetical protein YC2023_116344 [Brassica napus]